MMIVNGGGGGNETWRIPKCQARRTNITACKVHKESGKKHTHKNNWAASYRQKKENEQMPCRSWYKKKLIIMVLMRIWVEQMANKTPRTHRINGLIYSVVHVTPDMSGNGCRSFLSLSFSFQYAGEFPFQGVFPPPHKHIHAWRTCFY